MEYEVWGRYVNLALALFCLVLLMRKAFLYWGRYHDRTKDFWWVLTVWCLVIVFGTMEVLLEWDTDFRVFFTMFAMFLTIKVMLRRNEADQPTFTNEL